MIRKILEYIGRQLLLTVNICPVHRCSLSIGTAPVKYGLVQLTDHYRSARFEQFPVASSSVLGGCVVGPMKKAIVRYCKNCREAEEIWEAKNPYYWLNG